MHIVYERKVIEEPAVLDLLQTQLTRMCYVKRCDNDANTAMARLDAVDLLNWPKIRSDPEGNVFNRILTRRSFKHIRAVNECCLVMTSRSILDIFKEFLSREEMVNFYT